MLFKGQKRIFLDHASATPILPEAKKAMEKYWQDYFYNPSAIYEEAQVVKKDLLTFRTKVAEILKVAKENIIFTSGGTESDNLAILGTFERLRATIKTPHIIVSSLEHPAVLESVKEAERRGARVSVVEPSAQGFIDKEKIKALLTPATVLVSVSLVNGELGTIQPVGKIGRIIREFRKHNNTPYPYFHSDASQAVFTEINVEGMHIDLLSLDGGKFYGPKGVGLLVVRPPAVLHPITFGGGQERGLRSGTENVSLIAGFVTALEKIFMIKEREGERLKKLRERFVNEIRKTFNDAIIHGVEGEVSPHIISVSFPGVLAEFLAIQLDLVGILVSTGSACGTGKNEPGMNALRATGRRDLEESTIRFSFGLHTKNSDITRALSALKEVMHHASVCDKITP
ncbi:MAG: cysteine desulfurase family protein [Parcubacteria group bacterium]